MSTIRLNDDIEKSFQCCWSLQENTMLKSGVNVIDRKGLLYIVDSDGRPVKHKRVRILSALFPYRSGKCHRARMENNVRRSRVQL